MSACIHEKAFKRTNQKNSFRSERAKLKIPFNLEDAKELGLVLAKYKELHYKEVMIGVILVYIFLQTFAIPGSLFLSVLLGFLFDWVTAMVTICTCSTVGATLCFALSQFLGKRLVMHYFPDKIMYWAAEVARHR